MTIKHTLLQTVAAIALAVGTVDGVDMLEGAHREQVELHELAGLTEESDTTAPAILPSHTI